MQVGEINYYFLNIGALDNIVNYQPTECIVYKRKNEMYISCFKHIKEKNTNTFNQCSSPYSKQFNYFFTIIYYQEKDQNIHFINHSIM